jgi:hypothetical protein
VSNELLMMLLFLGLGVVFIMQGLPGLLSAELYIRGKYGRGTRYTGNKAVAMGFGTVAFGLLIILNGIFVATTKSPPKSPMMMAGFFIGVGVYLFCWIVSWFVSGTAVRERTKSWWW